MVTNRSGMYGRLASIAAITLLVVLAFAVAMGNAPIGRAQDEEDTTPAGPFKAAWRSGSAGAGAAWVLAR